MSIRTGTVQRAEFHMLFKPSLAIVLKQAVGLRYRKGSVYGIYKDTVTRIYTTKTPSAGLLQSYLRIRKCHARSKSNGNDLIASGVLTAAHYLVEIRPLDIGSFL